MLALGLEITTIESINLGIKFTSYFTFEEMVMRLNYNRQAAPQNVHPESLSLNVGP